MGTTRSEIEEARDWQGNLLDCSRCEQREGLTEGRCHLGHACVHDRYARRIDRFFRWNPDLAKSYLEHPYFETRAVAAKHVELFYLPRLVADPDETVRQSVAQRLPVRSKPFEILRHDPHRDVRVRVAERLEPRDLATMIGDTDYFVRQIVARRLPPGLLVKMIHDPDPEVRKVVAQRIAPEWLPTLAADTEMPVRLAAVRRMDNKQLRQFVKDPDWRLRYEVAGRLELADLEPLRADPDPAVRELVAQRLNPPRGEGVWPEAC
jgi:hypothetical protein